MNVILVKSTQDDVYITVLGKNECFRMSVLLLVILNDLEFIASRLSTIFELTKLSYCFALICLLFLLGTT